MMLRRFLSHVESSLSAKSRMSRIPRFSERLSYKRFSCWRCGRQEVGTSQCEGCYATFDLTKINYFELFGLPLNYDVDATHVVVSYHNLQKQFHPDKHTNDTEFVQEMSKKFSIFVNRAYKTLTSPIDRGVYILSLRGIPFKITTTDDQELLADVLEIDHDLSRASKETIFSIQKTLITTMNQLNGELSEAFKSKDYVRAQKILVKMKYYENLIQKSRTQLLKF